MQLVFVSTRKQNSILYKTLIISLDKLIYFQTLINIDFHYIYFTLNKK